MDLCELTNNVNRHPWESARANILHRVFQRYSHDFKEYRILDIGCGDVFTVSEVVSGVSGVIHGIDINFTQQDLEWFSSKHKNIQLFNNFEDIKQYKYNAIFLCDVLEHVEDDIGFLNEIVDNYLDPEGMLFCNSSGFSETIFCARSIS